MFRSTSGNIMFIAFIINVIQKKESEKESLLHLLLFLPSTLFFLLDLSFFPLFQERPFVILWG